MGTRRKGCEDEGEGGKDGWSELVRCRRQRRKKFVWMSSFFFFL